MKKQEYHISLEMKSKRRLNGFTLMEIIIVIAIIAILAAVAIPSVSGYVEKAKETSDLQVATNIIKNIQTGILLPGNNVPEGKYFAVFWSTDKDSENKSFHDHLLVIAPAPTRVSTISQSGVPPVTDPEELEEIAKSIFAMFRVEESEIIRGTSAELNGWWAPIEPSKSKVALGSKLYFHVDTTTGEVALAKYIHSDLIGNPNEWLEIGVEATPAP